jgi:hypothetical protein
LAAWVIEPVTGDLAQQRHLSLTQNGPILELTQWHQFRPCQRFVSISHRVSTPSVIKVYI